MYRATDTHLKRSVAIEVLPASVAGDADRLARFQREALLLAALNHPNIAAIYGLEKTEHLTALVMELVEGEDLSAHIARGAIPLADALPIAKQIADALEAAHEQGIIYRDLKPANITVHADGTVKVLDFGLAKAMDPAGASSGEAVNSPTMTANHRTDRCRRPRLRSRASHARASARAEFLRGPEAACALEVTPHVWSRPLAVRFKFRTAHFDHVTTGALSSKLRRQGVGRWRCSIGHNVQRSRASPAR